MTTEKTSYLDLENAINDVRANARLMGILAADLRQNAHREGWLTETDNGQLLQSLDYAITQMCDHSKELADAFDAVDVARKVEAAE